MSDRRRWGCGFGLVRGWMITNQVGFNGILLPFSCFVLFSMLGRLVENKIERPSRRVFYCQSLPLLLYAMMNSLVPNTHLSCTIFPHHGTLQIINPWICDAQHGQTNYVIDRLFSLLSTQKAIPIIY